MPESPPTDALSSEFMYETRHVILNYMGLVPNQHSELNSSGTFNYGSWPRKAKTSQFGYGTWPKKSHNSSQMPKTDCHTSVDKTCEPECTDCLTDEAGNNVTAPTYSHEELNYDYNNYDTDYHMSEEEYQDHHDDQINEDDINFNAMPIRTEVENLINTEEKLTVPPNSLDEEYNTVRQRILNNLSVITDNVDGPPNGNIFDGRQSPARPTSLSISPGPASTFNFFQHEPEIVHRPCARKRKLEEISGQTPDVMPCEEDADVDHITTMFGRTCSEFQGNNWRGQSSSKPDGSSKRTKANTPLQIRGIASVLAGLPADCDFQSPTSEVSSLSMSMRSTASNNVTDVQDIEWDILSRSANLSDLQEEGALLNIAQPYVDIALPLREELDYEKSKDHSYDTLPRQTSKASRQESVQSAAQSHRALSPESEVARRLNIISELVMQEYGHRLALEGAVQQVARLQRDQVSYASLRQILIQCGLMDGELRGWPMVAILLLFTQKVAFTLLKKGERGLGMLVDYTSQIIAEAAADFIVHQGGWESVFDADVVSTVMSASSASSVNSSPRKSQATSLTCSPKHHSATSDQHAKDIVDSVRSEIELLRQHSENLSAEIERDRMHRNLKSFCLTAIGVALIGVAAGYLFTHAKKGR